MMVALLAAALLPLQVPRARIEALARGIAVHAIDGPVVEDDLRQFVSLGFRNVQLESTSDVPTVRDTVDNGLLVVLSPKAGQPALDAATAFADEVMLHVGPATEEELSRWRKGLGRTTFVMTRPFGDQSEPPPPQDGNVVVEAVVSMPAIFVGQGRGEFRKLRDVPYPSSPRLVTPLLGNVEEADRERLMQYGRERWNAERLDRLARRIGEWGKRNRVPVIASVPLPSDLAPATARAAFVRDWRKALQANGVGWRLEDATAVGGLFKGPPGQRTADPDLLKALGL